MTTASDKRKWIKFYLFLNLVTDRKTISLRYNKFQLLLKRGRRRWRKSFDGNSFFFFILFSLFIVIEMHFAMSEARNAFLSNSLSAASQSSTASEFNSKVSNISIARQHHLGLAFNAHSRNIYSSTWKSFEDIPRSHSSWVHFKVHSIWVRIATECSKLNFHN